VKKAMIFIVGASIATHQMNHCVPYLEAVKTSYKYVIFESAEAKHYLEKAIMVPSIINSIAELKKAYEEASNNADLVPYYQNQYFRSELYNLAQSKKMSPVEIKPLLNQIDERIDALVEKYAEKIIAFEQANHYYIDKPNEEAMNKLGRSAELNRWSEGIRKSEPRAEYDKSTDPRTWDPRPVSKRKPSAHGPQNDNTPK
jgi:hypothetical protein